MAGGPKKASPKKASASGPKKASSSKRASASGPKKASSSKRASARKKVSKDDEDLFEMSFTRDPFGDRYNPYA
jgi:hypothetical protein